MTRRLHYFEQQPVSVMPVPAAIVRLWNKLVWIAPSGDMEIDQRRHFLAKILTVSLCLSAPIGLGLLPLSLNPESPASSQAIIASGLLAAAQLFCYFLNRFRANTLAALLFVVACMASTLYSALQAPFVLAFMSIEILLAMALLRQGHAIALSLLGLLSHGLLLLGPIHLSEIGLPAVINLTMLIMGGTMQSHYRVWELRRLTQVQQSRQWFETTLSSIGDAVLAVDPGRKLTFMNSVAEQLTGWQASTALGKPIHQVFDIINEATGEQAANPIDEVLLSKTHVDLANHTLLVSKDGVKRPIADSAAPIVGPEGELWGAVLVFRDMTREHELAAQLQHSHRLEALGQLAGGVAHDFNNLLTAMVGGLELAIGDIENSQRAVNELNEVRDACEQASGLTRQLLAFSRRQVMQPKPILLGEAVQRNQRLLDRLLRDDVIVKIDVQDGCWILTDPVQLDQVIMNLAINAGDAMPHGGTLTLSTARVQVTAERPIAALALGEYGRLRVSDTGRGIAEADRARIFEPFFTTKEHDRGTGLGLATAYGIAQQSGGGITVNSAIGEGTTFDVFFPAAQAHEEPQANSERGSGIDKKAARRNVLVVEDDPLVRTLIRKVLTQAGHSVVEAECGRAALAHLDSNQSFDLLLTDIVMPEMKGTEVATAFRKRFPDIPVLFTSGYADEAVAERGLAGPKQSFIAKPFTPRQLEQAVHEALGAERDQSQVS